MLKTRLFAAMSLVMITLMFSGSALACACCAERGYRSLKVETLDSYQLGLLKDMNMDDTAELYTDASGFESITGLTELDKEYNDGGLEKLNLVDSFLNNTWKITIKSPAGKTGTLVLPKPAKVTIYKADQHENPTGEAILYKEFIFNGTVGSGSGMFKAGIVKPTSYTLVFQGKGNMCDNAEDFNHWRLELNGSKAKYAFFGKMKA